MKNITNNYHPILLAFIMSICAISAIAGNKAKRDSIKAEQTRYNVNGTSLIFPNLYDSRMTNLNYVGIGLGFTTGTERERGDWLHWRHGQAQANIAINLQSGSNIIPGMASYKSYWTKYTVTKGKTKVYVGGGLDARYQIRYGLNLGNSAYNHDILAGIHAACVLRRPWTVFKRNALIDARFSMPVLSFINRTPAYGISGTFISYVKPIGAFFQWNSDLGVILPLSKYTEENKVRLSYAWDFFALNEINKLHKLRVANHIFSVTYLYKF